MSLKGKDSLVNFPHEYNVPKQQLILQLKYNFKDMNENNELRNFSVASCWWKEGWLIFIEEGVKGVFAWCGIKCF